MLYWLSLSLVLLPLLIERVLVVRARRQIRLRIHVHGTRGKSSVVRECARLLREKGMTVLAKTTGDRPEYILPDGQNQAIRRIGPARIKEHVAMLTKAAWLKADAVIVEGMALTPETIWQSENMLHATHAVITNTRPDHAESMGDGRQGVIRNLALMIPEKGTLIAAVEDGVEQLAQISEARQSPAHPVACSAYSDQTGDLAKAVAELVLPQPLAVGPASSTTNAPHWQDVLENDLPENDLPVRFLDLLSANDVESSVLLWAVNRPDADWLTVALLATRADRPLRSRDFWTWLQTDRDFDLLVPQGDHAGYCWLNGWRNDRMVFASPWSRPSGIIRKLIHRANVAGKSGVAIVGLGNVHGTGKTWRRFMQEGRRHAG